MTSVKSISTRLHESDNTVVEHTDIQTGAEIKQEGTIAREPIPFGHKIATASIKAGEAVKKYGQIIGFASRDIKQANMFTPTM